MNYYNKYLKYKNKYLNFIIKGGNGIQLSFTNSKNIKVSFNHTNNIIYNEFLYNIKIQYSLQSKIYEYYYFFDECDNGVIFSSDFKNWFKLLKNPQSIKNIMPKYSDNNIFNIEDNKYIFYYYYNKSRNVNILDTNKISEIDKNKIIEEFTKVKNNSFISFDINYDENNKSSYYIYFNIFNNKTYGFIRNKSNNDWKYLVCNKIVNVLKLNLKLI
jgi:hypothetical protein